MAITKEELESFAKSDEGKALFGDVAKGLGFGDTTGLVNKNKELLGEIRDLKDKYASIDQQFAPFKGLNPDEVKAAIEKSKNPNPKIEDDPRFNNLALELKQIKGRLEAETAEKEKANKILEDKEKTDRISNALKEAGFAPEYHEVLTTSFKQKAVLKRNENGSISVVVDDGTSVNDIADFAKAYAKTDAGKPFLPRPENTSAGAQKYNLGGANAPVTRADLRDPAKRKAALDQMRSGNSVSIAQ